MENSTGTIAKETADSNHEVCFDLPIVSSVQWIGYPVLLVLCTVGNILCLYALYRYREKCSSTVYLVAVAICDLCVLWFYMGTFLVEILDLSEDRMESWVWNQYVESRGIVLWWRHTCIQLSDWVLMAYIIERFVTVYRSTAPAGLFIVITKDAFRRALITVAILGLLSAIFQSGDLVRQAVYLAKRHGFPVMTNTSHVVEPLIQRWHDAQTTGEIAMMLVKGVLIAVLNCMLAYQMSRAQASRRLLVRHVSEASTSSVPHSVLLISGALYLVTQTPTAVCEAVFLATGKDYCCSFIPLINTLSLSNYSLNFFMYCLVTQKFRRFLECPGKRSSLTSTRSNSSDTSKISASA
ncbi:hypothetical protein RvY_10986 [Ramazzottius varieornatus]|uniref:G-protein coupled receptors family 1 profile domain-containing protein n=1 Tax=Ramazzottius varieornatus TaxID=947166 RepID=A0A1D1VK22_RAMVA|nr:hypothetical protein RvY_10986 [Ramazzottius varieornatus]